MFAFSAASPANLPPIGNRPDLAHREHEASRQESTEDRGADDIQQEVRTGGSDRPFGRFDDSNRVQRVFPINCSIVARVDKRDAMRLNDAWRAPAGALVPRACRSSASACARAICVSIVLKIARSSGRLSASGESDADLQAMSCCATSFAIAAALPGSALRIVMRTIELRPEASAVMEAATCSGVSWSPSAETTAERIGRVEATSAYV